MNEAERRKKTLWGVFIATSASASLETPFLNDERVSLNNLFYHHGLIFNKPKRGHGLSLIISCLQIQPWLPSAWPEPEKEEDKMLLKMPQKLLKTAHYIELGSYQHWPVLIPQRIRLYTYEQIPVFLKENPYITDGYRAHLPSKLCLRRWEK